MHLPDGADTVPALPSPNPQGTPGYFTRGDPGTGTPASVIDQDTLNMLVVELLSIVLAAGITPDQTKANYAQVLQALNALYAAIGHVHSAAQITSGTFADARIAQSNVTQHQAALAALLSLGAGQITSGTFADARISQSSVTQHQAALALAASQITSGTFADARISQSSVTQHQAALAALLSLGAGQITSGVFAPARLPAASDAAAGAIQIAPVVEMEAGASAVKAVTPARQHRHASAAKFWVNVSSSQTISASYNVASVIDNGTGDVTVNIGTDFSGLNWCAQMSTTTTPAGDGAVVNPIIQAADSVRVRINDLNDVNVDNACFVSGYGAQV